MVITTVITAKVNYLFEIGAKNLVPIFIFILSLFLPTRRHEFFLLLRLGLRR